MTPRSLVAATLALAVTSLGCVSKAKHEALQATADSLQKQLDACTGEKNQALDVASGLQKRLNADEERFRNLDATIATLPEMQKEWEEERKSILTMVPREIRSQVGEKLDRHFATMSGKMNELQSGITSLEGQLTSARDEIAALRGQTEGVSQKVDAANATLTGENADLKKQLAAQRTTANTLVKKVTDFDATYLNCQDCEERLKMKEKSREALRSLHGDLVSGLSELQGK